MWGNQKVEKFESNTQQPGSPSMVETRANALDGNREIALTQVGNVIETAQNLQKTLNDMDVTKLLESIRSLTGGVNDVLREINLLRSELRICCGKVDALSQGQAKIIGKTTGLEIAAGTSGNVWMNRLAFGLSATTVILILVVIFMLSKGTCRR